MDGLSRKSKRHVISERNDLSKSIYRYSSLQMKWLMRMTIALYHALKESYIHLLKKIVRYFKSQPGPVLNLYKTENSSYEMMNVQGKVSRRTIFLSHCSTYLPLRLFRIPQNIRNSIHRWQSRYCNPSSDLLWSAQDSKSSTSVRIKHNLQIQQSEENANRHT